MRCGVRNLPAPHLTTGPHKAGRPQRPAAQRELSAPTSPPRGRAGHCSTPRPAGLRLHSASHFYRARLTGRQLRAHSLSSCTAARPASPAAPPPLTAPLPCLSLHTRQLRLLPCCCPPPHRTVEALPDKQYPAEIVKPCKSK